MNINTVKRNQLSALTRAKKKGPQAVIDAVKVAYEQFDLYGWPDQWHTWEIAKSDAELELRYGR